MPSLRLDSEVSRIWNALSCNANGLIRDVVTSLKPSWSRYVMQHRVADHQSGVCSRVVRMSVLLALLLLLSATWTASARDCRLEDVHFEMMTGYVYSAPGEIMVTSPGVLLLRDCLEQCRRNDSCRAINFETGLCVLFSGSYTDQPGRFYMGI